MLWTKRAHQCAIFRLLGALMKVHPILHTIFKTARSGFIQILHHCSVSWKITPLYFFSSNLIYFGQKLLVFWVVWWKFTKFLMSYLKLQVSFSLNFASLFSVMGDKSSCWNFIWFLQKEPTKMQNFRLLTAQVKWAEPHDIKEWCKIWRKTYFLFQKWQEFGEV